MVELSLAPGAGFAVESLPDLDVYLGALSDAGFPCVSLSVSQLGDDVEAANRLVRAHGLRCSDVLTLQVSRHEEEVMARTEAMAQAAETLGAEYVLALMWARVNEESIDRFGRCAELVRRAGARLALEMPPISELNSISAALDVVRAAGFSSAALMVDTFHFSRGASTWEELETLPLDGLGYIQFDDALPAETEDVMYETTNRRTMPGDGEFELERFARTLTDRGWSGVVSVEVLSAQLRELDIATFAHQAYKTSVPYWSH